MLDCGTLAENTANLLVRLLAEAQEAKIGFGAHCNAAEYSSM